MGIINTLEKCLDSPYLFHDPEAPSRVGGLLETASRRIDDARAIQDATESQGDPGDITLMSYEAMFACVRALVYAKGYREAGLRCLLLACEKFYVVPGQLDPSLIHAMGKAQGYRGSPEEALTSAIALLERTQALLATSSAQAG